MQWIHMVGIKQIILVMLYYYKRNLKLHLTEDLQRHPMLLVQTVGMV